MEEPFNSKRLRVNHCEDEEDKLLCRKDVSMNTVQTYDVLVIGSGIAGLSAAIEAASQGARVCVIEQLPKAGGNTLISDGGIAVPSHPLQKKEHIDDSPELLIEDMLKAGKHKNDPALVKKVASEAYEAFRWTEAMGVVYQDRLDFFGGHSVPRCLTTQNKKGKDFINVMTKKALSLGVRFHYRTTIESFRFSDKVLKAVIAHDHKGMVHQFSAFKSVVVASGGFGSNQTLIHQLKPHYKDLMSTNLPSAQGTVLTLLEASGAKLIDMDAIQCGPWGSPLEKGFGLGPLFADYIALPYGVLLDPIHAKRFINERVDRQTVSEAMLRYPYALALTDAKMVLERGWSLEALITKQIVTKHENLEALAKAYNLKSEALQTTIHEYNHAIEKHEKDPFGKDLKVVSPLKTAPFYVMKTVPKIHHTMGGLAIDTNARVLGVDNTPYINLFAAGECTGGVHGHSRLGSMALVDGLVMGRTAGREATKR